MQFLILSHDGKNVHATERRLNAGQAHIDLGEELRQSGNIWYVVSSVAMCATLADKPINAVN